MSFAEEWKTIQAKIHKNAVDLGFWDKERNEGEIIALIHSELSEGLEALRKDLDDDKVPEFKGIEAELADAVIRIMDYAEGYNYRVVEAIESKMLMNQSRERMHGKKF